MRRIIDLRDPWRGVNKSFPQYGMDPNWIYPLIALLEPVLFRFAHKVIVNTREFAKELQSARPQLSIVHVSNGIDLETLPTRTAERFDGISIAYVGTFYAGRSFGTVISALKAVSRDRPNEASRITLRIAGQIDSGHRDQLRASLAQDGLEGSLEFLGNIPRPDALDLLRRSHLALVLAQNQRTQIPAKLYECVGLSVPTLVISETDSAASREARRIGAIAVDPDDATRIQEVLNSLLDGTFPATLTAATPISYELLAAKVDQIIGEGGDQRRMGTPSLRSIERFGDVH